MTSIKSSPAQTTQSLPMQYFSQQAGPLQKSQKKQPTIGFTPSNSSDKSIYRLWAYVLAYGCLALVVLLTAILFEPAHWVARKDNAANNIGNWLMLGILACLQIMLLIGTYSATRATIKARNPQPLEPVSGLRVAFATSRAPGEPIAMVRRTLAAAKRLRYDGIVDVWLLDETENYRLMQLCDELDVNYFTRKGIDHWNSQPVKHGRFGQAEAEDPRFAARTKHGNYNAWGEHLDARGYRYDVIAAVDTDHVPEVNFLERLLGYFRDPDVAYVVGPQVYGNIGGGLRHLITRWAESQASFFQSTIQRAANATNSAMFVGTNYAARTTALSQIGGFYPCITEDLATGISIHAQQNPQTGQRWKSVYTPDVLAVGEGPDFWSSYFSQQWRWAAGAFDACKRLVWRVDHQLSWPARLHYYLILTYYPITALTWLLGIASSCLYLLFGASAITVAWNQFISLYLMSAVLQLSVYVWNRRYDVSPFNRAGSYGVSGMLLSSLTAPIYLSALCGVLSGRRVNFVVTKKGRRANPDWIRTFRTHLQWALLLGLAILYGLLHGRNNPAMLLWVATQFIVCLLPLTLGMRLAIPTRWQQYRKTHIKAVTGVRHAPGHI